MRKDFAVEVGEEGGKEEIASGREEWRVVEGEEELFCRERREGGRR